MYYMSCFLPPFVPGYFYSGTVDKVDFSRIDEEIRERTNKMITMKTDGRVKDFMKHDHPTPEGPLALFAANYFKVKTCLEPFCGNNSLGQILLQFKFHTIY